MESKQGSLVSLGGRAVTLVALVALVLVLRASARAESGGINPWTAPAESRELSNVSVDRAASVAQGKELFQTRCKLCHGPLGRGDGPTGKFLQPKPTDLTSSVVTSQTDGEIFWKISEGNPPMPAHKEILSEEQRWSLVDLIRSLSTGIAAAGEPSR
ncbi:MAG: cytochrome c [Candidatus Schekmanbacteria bacterium]|nr:cytochrome c [Candidatus Schekmanbacteria bacterium]